MVHPPRGEFQRILRHPEVVGDEPIGALAHLGVARAFVLQGDATKAHSSSHDFLSLWKDADPNIPLLRQAQAAFAKLR